MSTCQHWLTQVFKHCWPASANVLSAATQCICVVWCIVTTPQSHYIQFGAFYSFPQPLCIHFPANLSPLSSTCSRIQAPGPDPSIVQQRPQQRLRRPVRRPVYELPERSPELHRCSIELPSCQKTDFHTGFIRGETTYLHIGVNLTCGVWCLMFCGSIVLCPLTLAHRFGSQGAAHY